MGHRSDPVRSCEYVRHCILSTHPSAIAAEVGLVAACCGAGVCGLLLNVLSRICPAIPAAGWCPHFVSYPPPPPQLSAGPKADYAAQPAAGLSRDYLALKELYRATNGGSWTNNTGWDTTYAANQVTRNILSQFFGVHLYLHIDYVQRLELVNNNLTGSLPDKISEMDSLRWLILDKNSISGSIPTQLGNLSQLEDLRLHENLLSGSIPSSLGNLTRLSNLGLSSNNLTGTIPLNLYDCRKLTFLELKNNGFTGSISTDIYKLSKLQILNLKNNKFTGPIPSQIGNLTDLVFLELGNCYDDERCGSNENAFTGAIPSEIGRLTKLRYLDLRSVNLSGPIPSQLGNLTKLEIMELQGNSLSGPIPSQLGNLTKLEAMELQGNSLSGPIPSQLGNLGKVVLLDLRSNTLTGAIPPSLGQLRSVVMMDLSENALSGPIPSELSGATALITLILEKNKITGKIPPELGTLPSLLRLSVAHNKLIGSIPKELENLPKIQSLELNDNQLSGPIPTEIGLLKTLIQFTVQNNDLKGELPRDLLGIKQDLPNGLFGLAMFDFRGQLLCASYDDEFRSWMESIDATAAMFGVPGGGAHGPFCLTWSSDDIIDLLYMQNRPIKNKILPGAMEGSGIRPFTFSMRTTPPGLTFDAQTRTLSGTPTQVHPRDVYYYSMADSSGRTKQMDIYVEVIEELRLDSIPDMGFAVGEPIWEFTFPSATGGLASDYRYSMSPPDAPAGLSFSRAGTETMILSGTPSEITPPTTYTFTVESARWDASQEFTIEVYERVSFTHAVTDQTYVLEVEAPTLQLPAATGGELPYAYVLEPALPEGLSFDDNPEVRTLSGKPAVLWPRTQYVYTVYEASGRNDTVTFHIEVLAPLQLAQGVADQEYVVGEKVSRVFPEAGGGRPPYDYAIIPDPPAGLDFDVQQRTLSGTPPAVSPRQAYVYRVTDGSNQADSASFFMEIVDVFSLSLVADQNYELGKAIAPLKLPSAQGGQPPYTYALSPDPPAGLVIDTLAHMLSGTPTAIVAPLPYTWAARDSTGRETSQTFTIAVDSVFSLLEGEREIVFVVDKANSAVLPRAVGGRPSYSYALSPAPPDWLNFDGGTRRLSGTPPAVSSPIRYMYTATDAVGREDSSAFDFQVVGGLTLSAVPDQEYMVGVEIAVLVLPVAIGGQKPYEYTLTPEVPAGLRFDPQTRRLSGTPAAEAAETEYTYTVKDKSGQTSSQVFDLAVWSTLALPEVEDQAYSLGLAISDYVLPEATGGRGSNTYTLAPDLPSGITFDEQTRTLSGTPAALLAPSTYTYTVTDEDEPGWVAARTFLMEVSFVLVLPSVADQEYAVGSAVPELVLPEATGGRGPYRYTLQPLPDGLAFDSAARTLSGTPTEVWEKAPTTYEVTDAGGRTDTSTFDIEVLEGLMLAAIADQAYTIGEAIPALVLPEATGGRSPYAYALRPEPPAGLAFDSTARRLSGTPTVVMNPTPYVFTATDAGQRTAKRTFNIVVGASAALINDRAALIALYETSDGANWTNSTNWLNPPADVVAFTAQDLEAWFGITMSEAGRVARVELPDNNLQGRLPAEVGNLSALEQLRLYGNALEGTIPSSLGQLAMLQGLLLHDNGLTGEIPSSLNGLAALKQLHLHNNSLAGPVPGSLGGLSALEQLWLYGNALEGPIPAALGQLAQLQGLLLHDNGLTGEIPSSLGQLLLLEDLWLHGNALAGPIPAALGQLTNLRELLLHDNGLTGEIPSSLGQLPRLEDLWLHGNALAGTIPSSLGQLGKVQELWLHGNALEGPIPSSLGQLGNLRVLLLHDNKLTGELPSSLGQLAQLEWLQVSGNALTGRLPDSLGALGSLEYLYLHGNALTGRLPGTLRQLTALKELFFGGQELCAPADELLQAWLAARETVKGSNCGGAALSFAVPVLDQRFTVGVGIEDLVLPPAEGGAAPYQYTLYPDLPIGLKYDEVTRTLYGVPRDTVSSAAYTYTATDGAGNKGHMTFTVSVEPGMHQLLQLYGNYPNPFRGTTRVELSLARDAEIGVEVFDLLGRRILEQPPRHIEAGARQSLEIAGMAAVPGMYLYRIVAVIGRETLVRTGRMTLVR